MIPPDLCLELVDGQQRITTLHVMAAAARDALIVTGHQGLLWSCNATFCPPTVVNTLGFLRCQTQPLLQPQPVVVVETHARALSQNDGTHRDWMHR